MTDRRSFLLGSAPLAVFLSAGPALARDREEQSLLERIHALWRDHRVRADRVRDSVVRTVGPAIDLAALDTVAEGLAWSALAASCTRERPHDLAHPAFQAVLREAATAIGEVVRVLDAALARVDPAAVSSGAFLDALDGVVAALDDGEEDPFTRAKLGDARQRLAGEIQRDGLRGVVARKRRRIGELEKAGAGLAGGEVDMRAAPDVALLTELADGQAAWASAGPLPGEPMGLSPVQAVGLVVLGLMIAGGLVVFASSFSYITGLGCWSIAAALMLLSLTMLAIGVGGILAIAAHARAVQVGTLLGPGWHPIPFGGEAESVRRLWAVGLLHDPASRWSFGPSGRWLCPAPDDAPLPKGPLGALIGRSPGLPGGPFAAVGERLSAAAAQGLELAVNVAPSAALTGRGFRIYWLKSR